MKHVAIMDVFGNVLVSRYIHITDMFYGTKGVIRIALYYFNLYTVGRSPVRKAPRKIMFSL
jgi:hypothetical protein